MNKLFHDLIVQGAGSKVIAEAIEPTAASPSPLRTPSPSTK